jgi:hypothetical protein
METFHLLDLAAVSATLGGSQGRSIRATACAIILANRHTQTVLSGEAMAETEREAGRAVLTALVKTPLGL